MPSKHINFSQSLLGFGSYLLTKIDSPVSVDDLWDAYQEDYRQDRYYAKHTLENLILTLVFLYGINAITEKNGMIERCN
ncbi:MAG: hypothetical protein LC102_01060 [Ignavibacteriales bacterium]|jgi:hypothetical protein|nr:MAG: hypothetical protein F9K26_12325 [Ignavibacteriaceae bacterium]MBW7872136.1 hypothetical protein [Ignavibacteria bacterium]MCZ2142002.1 hypothetical protein [Ignavibacteriales bacterium]MBV6445970.1 hypothetical protein [Ignavibacteriaceae bacterium]MBZ0196114.1 hypothetical protein [Ignavibacteriaceae bacterium]